MTQVKRRLLEMKRKKLAGLLLVATMALGMMAGCGKAQSTDTDSAASTGASGDITILSREDGSGTRGAFIELFGIEEKDENGEKIDMTTEDAKITNSTSVMMTTVAGDVNSLGYISLGSLDDTVTAVKIDGVEATAENVSNGTYKISRPFNIATKGDMSEAAQDFVNFILSKEGQAVITDNGYISIAEGEVFTSSNPSGKITIAGSSSVTPVMEKLVEAYGKINDKVEIEVQESDSSTGMQSTIDGLCDIGMASRELKDSETEAGLTATAIALDGIAVIVNNESGITDLTSEQVKQIYTGEILTWDELK